MRERFARSYDYIKPEIIEKAEITIGEYLSNASGISHHVLAIYTGENGEKVVYDCMHGKSFTDDYLEITAKKSNLNKYVQEKKETQLEADKQSRKIEINYLEEETLAQAEQKPAENDSQKEVSVFDESGNVRTEFTKAEIDRLLVYENTESNPFYMGSIQILDFGPEQITAKTNFDTTGREKIEVDITEITKISEKEVQLYMRNGIDDKDHKLKARKITLPKPQRGDLVGIKTPFGGYIYKIYDGEWSKDKKKGEKAIKITG